MYYIKYSPMWQTASRVYFRMVPQTGEISVVTVRNYRPQAQAYLWLMTRVYISAWLESFQEFLGRDSGPGVHCKLHLTDFLVYFLHEMNNKVNDLVFVHLLRMEVCDEETDVISLQWNKFNILSYSLVKNPLLAIVAHVYTLHVYKAVLDLSKNLT